MKESVIKGLDIQILWHWQRPEKSGVRKDLTNMGD